MLLYRPPKAGTRMDTNINEGKRNVLLRLSAKNNFVFFVFIFVILRVPALGRPVSSVRSLAPLNFRRERTGLVSYYAFFKGWLLLSQPPSCISPNTTFPT